MSQFDCIVVGSGFGGSVMALRLVEKGYRVLLLERGKQWPMQAFPRTPNEIQKNLFWDPEDRKKGLMEIRNYPDSDLMSVTASGLGGGSLIYANVLLKMPPENFKGWPRKINRESLNPYYEKVLKMLAARPFPTEKSGYSEVLKTKIFSELSKKLQSEQNPDFIEGAHPPLAINFEGSFLGAQTVNEHGVIQSSCTNCGQCDIGCNIHAKNTLDLNYLARAQSSSLFKNPLTVMTDFQVSELRQTNGKYIVSNVGSKESFTCDKLFICAGAIGSTELLLKNKANGNLSNLNNMLGKKVCGSGDFLGLVLDAKQEVEPTKGPVITSYLNFKHSGHEKDFPGQLYIQDAGYPAGLAWFLSGKVPQILAIKNQFRLALRYILSSIKRCFKISESEGFEVNIGDDLSAALERGLFISKSMMLLGMGRDQSDGEMILNSKKQAVIKWDEEKSRPHFDKVEKYMEKVAALMGGRFLKNPVDFVDKIITVHPLGGCPMGDSSDSGFVDAHGRVYGYKDLYVVDGSILPTSTGPNPSLTIAALAEFIADQISDK